MSLRPAVPSDGLEERVRAALRREANRYQVRVDPGRVRAAMAERGGWKVPRWWPMAAVAVAIAAMVAAIFLFLPEPSPTSLGPTPRPTPARSAAVVAPGPLSADTPITLAGCDILPQDAPLAFAGWSTMDLLKLANGRPTAGQPVYALVTQGSAGWIEPGTRGDGPMYQGRAGRMGCVYDPATDYTSIIGVPDAWQPPAVAGGCPVTPVNDYGGYREIGGPHAWLALPDNPASWYVGGNFSYLLSFRLSPPARAGDEVTAWAQPLAPSGRIDAQVQVSPTPALATPPPNSRFYFVNLTFSNAGCWVINLAVNGSVAGSAVIAIGAISGQPQVAPAPTVP